MPVIVLGIYDSGGFGIVPVRFIDTFYITEGDW